LSLESLPDPTNRSTDAALGRLGLARNVAALGDWVAIVGFLIYGLTQSESAAILSVLIAAQLLPTFLLGPLARRVIARFDDAGFGVGAQLLRAVLFLPLVLIQTTDGILPVLGIALISSVPVAFTKASRSVLLSSVIRPDRASIVEPRLAFTSLVTMVAGPILGSVAYGVADLRGTGVAVSAALLISSGFLLFVRPAARTAGAKSGFSDFAEFSALPLGIAHSFGNPRFQAVATVQMTTALLAGGLAIAEATYAINGLYVPIENIAVLLATQGAGGIIGAILYRWLASRHTERSVIAAGLTIVASGELGFAISKSLTAGATLTAAVGAGLSLVALGLAHVSPKLLAGQGGTGLRGPGMGIAVEAAALLSVIVVGPMCDTIGARFTIVTGAILMVVLALYSFGAIPEPAPMPAGPEGPPALTPELRPLPTPDQPRTS
jgi:hypothetical protein